MEPLCGKRRTRQEGFGILEGLVGMIVLSLLAFLATKGFTLVVGNNQETKRMKGVQDIVILTAERLGTYTLAELRQPSMGYNAWTTPEPIQQGKYSFRYRITEGPGIPAESSLPAIDRGNILPVADPLLGLEIETGVMEGGSFSARNTYATLITPLRERSTVTNRPAQEAERAFYARHTAEIAATKQTASALNSGNLNSHHCQDLGDCCSVMQDFYINGRYDDSANIPTDGHEEKCYYRCALNADVSMEQLARCGIACGDIRYNTEASCCEAVRNGTCGFLCRRMCRECTGLDSLSCDGADSTCRLAPYFSRNVDCARFTWCDGSPLPESHPDFGNFRQECPKPACQRTSCYESVSLGECCGRYWKVRSANIAAGLDPHHNIEGRLSANCPRQTSEQQCCMMDPIDRVRGKGTVCGGDGRAIQTMERGYWRCARETEHANCVHLQGCSETFIPNDMPATCVTNIPAAVNTPTPTPSPSPTPNPPPPPPPVVRPPSTPIPEVEPRPRRPGNRPGRGTGSGGSREN